MQHRWQRRKYYLGGDRAVWERLWLMVIFLNLDKRFHFGIAILILNASPHLSLVFICHCVFLIWDIQNACPRLLQFAEIPLQDVVCPASRSLLFSFHLHMVKRKYRFLRHDLLLWRGYLNLLQLLSLLSFLQAVPLIHASVNSLQSGYNHIYVPVMCVMLLTFLHSLSDGHSDLLPNPASAHHALNATHRPSICPCGVLTVISRGLTLAFQQIAVIHRGCYHVENFLTTVIECVWDRSLLFFHFALVSSHHKDMQLPRHSKLAHQDQELLQVRSTTNWC